MDRGPQAVTAWGVTAIIRAGLYQLVLQHGIRDIWLLDALDGMTTGAGLVLTLLDGTAFQITVVCVQPESGHRGVESHGC